MAQTVRVTYELIDRVSSNLTKINENLTKYENRLKALDKLTNEMSKDKNNNLSNFAKTSAASFKDLNKELTTLNQNVDGTKRVKLDSFATRVGTLGTKAQSATSKVNLLGNALNSQDEVMDQLVPKMETHVANTKALGDAAHSTAKEVRDQNTALRENRDVVDGFARSMNTIASAEVKVKRAMDLKNRSAGQQVTHLRAVGRAADAAERRLAKTANTTNALKKAFQSGREYSFFNAGVESGAGFLKVLVAINGMLPLVGVAGGGLLGVVNSLGAGIVGLGGSLTSLAGTLSLMPGLYASMGIAMLGVKSIAGTIVKPSMQGVEELKALDQQIAAQRAQGGSGASSIASAERSLANQKRRAGQVAERTLDPGASLQAQQNFANAQANSAAGVANAEATLQAARDSAGKANAANAAQLAALEEKRTKLVQGMPANAQLLYDKVQKLKEAWRNVWFGAGNKRADQIIDQLILGMSGLQVLMTALDPSVQRLVNLFGRVAKYVNYVSTSPMFQGLFEQVLNAGVDNLSIMFSIFQNMLPLGLRLLILMQGFTKRVLESVEAWSKQKRDISGFKAYLDRAYDSLMLWTRSLINFGAGILTLFSDANGATDLFEGSLERMSVRWRNWTAEVTANGDAARYFENSWKILGALGGVFLSIGKAMGTVGSSTSATDAIVGFLEQVGRGIETFGRYSERTTSYIGPKLTEFFSTLGSSMSNMSEPTIKTVGFLIDLSTKLLGLMEFLPDSIRNLLGWLLPMKLALFVIGGQAGQILSIGGAFDALRGRVRWAAKGMWGFVAAQKAAAMSAPGKAATRAGAAAGAANLGVVPIKKGWGSAVGTGGAAAATLGASAVGPSSMAALASAAAAAAPVIAVVAAVLLAVGAAVYAVKTDFMGTADFLNRVWNSTVERFSQAFGNIVDQLGGGEAVMGKLHSALDVMKSILGFLGAVVVRWGAVFLQMFINPIIFAMKTIASFIGRVKELWHNLASGKGVIQSLQDFLDGFARDTLGNLMSTMAESLVSIFGAPFERAINGAIDIVNNGINKVNKIKGVDIDKIDYITIAAGAKKRQEQEDWEKAAPGIEKAENAQRNFAMTKFSRGKTPATVKGKSKPAATVQDVYNTGVMPGYTQTTTQGAEVKWNMNSVGTFVGVSKRIEQSFDPMFREIRRIPRIFGNAMSALIKEIRSSIPTVVNSMQNLGRQMTTPLSNYLRKIVDEVNAVITSTGGEAIDPLGSGGGSSSNQSNRGGGNTNGTRAGGPALPAMPGGGAINWNGHPAGNSALGPYVKAAQALGVMVSSTTDYQHAKGSQHYSGDAVDLSNGSAPTPEMDRLYASLVPHAKSGAIGQLIYRNNFWDHGVQIPGIGGHDNHVHVGLGTGAGGAINLMDALSLSAPPEFAKSLFSGANAGLARMAFEALTQSGGASPFSADAPGSGGGGDMKAIIRAAAAAYGAKPDGLLRVAQAESTLNPNAANDWDSNAKAGIPSKGLFQFIEPTFNSMSQQAMRANPSAWTGVSRQWMDPTAQALTAAWAFTNGQGSHWATYGQYGRGGSFMTNGPGTVLVGDNPGGRERVTVTPTTGPHANPGGSGPTIHTTVVVQGGIFTNGESIKQLSNEVGKHVAKDVVAALRSHSDGKDL